MATSAVTFEGRHAFINDASLYELIKAIAFNLKSRVDEGSEHNWLILACCSWMDEYETMPPGLRDIDLDRWLIAPERKEMFRAYLQWLKSVPIDREPYDSDVLIKVIDRLELELFDAAGST